jgi:hypothetical protein
MNWGRLERYKWEICEQDRTKGKLVIWGGGKTLVRLGID